jgi:hypothetical protein
MERAADLLRDRPAGRGIWGAGRPEQRPQTEYANQATEVIGPSPPRCGGVGFTPLYRQSPPWGVVFAEVIGGFGFRGRPPRGDGRLQIIAAASAPEGPAGIREGERCPNSMSAASFGSRIRG